MINQSITKPNVYKKHLSLQVYLKKFLKNADQRGKKWLIINN